MQELLLAKAKELLDIDLQINCFPVNAPYKIYHNNEIFIVKIKANNGKYAIEEIIRPVCVVYKASRHPDKPQKCN